MKHILHKIDIKKKLVEQLEILEKELIIITAFCKLETLKFVESIIHNKKINKKILVRLRLDDILNKATDLEIYEFCKNNNWDIFFDFDIHSKIYIFDNLNVMIGSANLTSNGIGLSLKKNIESVIFESINNEELNDIDKIFQNSMRLDDSIYFMMLKQVNSMSTKKIEIFKWNNDINNLIICKNLYIADLIFSENPFDLLAHDKLLLNIKEHDSFEIIVDKFKKSKIFKWLKNNIDKEMYFGELTEILHDSLIDSPKPYRKNIKILLMNIINWLIILKIDDFKIDKPNYSTRIKPLNE